MAINSVFVILAVAAAVVLLAALAGNLRGPRDL
jgi:hypothetical protein